MTEIPPRYPKAQRRLLTAIGGLGVLALAAATFVLSYDDLRTLAIQGGAVRHRAFLYPSMLDGLVVVVILSILAAGRSRWWTRAVRWLLLLVLVAGAGAAGVNRAVRGYAGLPHDWLAGGVAAAPWVILAIAVWLWVSMIKQMLARRARRNEPDPRPEPMPPTIVDEPVNESIIPGFADDELDTTARLPAPVTMPELGPAATGPMPLAAADRVVPSAPETAPGSSPLPDGGPGFAAPGNETPESDVVGVVGDDLSGSGRAPHDEGAAGPPEPPLSPDGVTEPDDEPTVEAPMDRKPVDPTDQEPTAYLVARPSLPTDVRLVGPRKPLSDTQPDGIRLPTTRPDGIPMPVPAKDDAAYATDRTEGSDDEAGSRADGAGRAKTDQDEITAQPPAGTFRSSPTPPRD